MMRPSRIIAVVTAKLAVLNPKFAANVAARLAKYGLDIPRRAKYG